MLKAAGLPGFQIEGTEIVGPTVGAELRRQAIYATVLSMLGITAWIAIRFRVSFAMGSIVATFHDVLVTLAFLAFFRYEMTLNVIAAMLTMVGYSMNDMIVIFDRVRENTRLQRREPLESAINTSLNQTLTRTVITSGTVFMAVLALFLFGGEVLRGFAFTMLAGTIATTYSGWFIAPSLAIMLSKKPIPRSVACGGRDHGVRTAVAQVEIAAQSSRNVNASIAGVTLVAAALLGLIQGVTEFLPISSTAHLLLVGQMLGYEDPVFTVMIQLGSILAVDVAVPLEDRGRHRRSRIGA